MLFRSEDLWNEAMEQGLNEARKASALRMLTNSKYTLDDIVDITGLSLEEVKKLQNEKSA